jgi:glycosyltransferase involved in cell wall biosynthesis
MSPFKLVTIGPLQSQCGGITTVQNAILQRMDDEFEMRHIAEFDDGSVFHKILIYLNAWVSLMTLLLRGEVDLVHFHVSEKGSVLRIALLALGVKLFGKFIVIHTHGPEFHVFYDSQPRLLQRAISRFFRMGDRVIVLSQHWQQYYIQILGLDSSKLTILPNPITYPQDVVCDRDRRVNIVSCETLAAKITVVFLGRLGQRKGIYDLLDAYAALPGEIQSRSQLIVAGDGEIEQVQQYVERLKLSNLVRVLGWIDRNERDLWLSQSDIFVLPSYNEGLPLALLEAMGWGLVTIATPVGGIPEYVIPNQTGLLVEPGNRSQLIYALQRAIADAPLRLSLGRAARTKVKELDIEVYMRSLRQLYRNLVCRA